MRIDQTSPNAFRTHLFTPRGNDLTKKYYVISFDTDTCILRYFKRDRHLTPRNLITRVVAGLTVKVI